MEKVFTRIKPKQIIIPTIVIMIVVYILSQYLEDYKPKYFWNILLAIPIGFFINTILLNLIKHIIINSNRVMKTLYNKTNT